MRRKRVLCGLQFPLRLFVMLFPNVAVRASAGQGGYE